MSSTRPCISTVILFFIFLRQKMNSPTKTADPNKTTMNTATQYILVLFFVLWSISV